MGSAWAGPVAKGPGEGGTTVPGAAGKSVARPLPSDAAPPGRAGEGGGAKGRSAMTILISLLQLEP
jgi:hypothetical protein